MKPGPRHLRTRPDPGQNRLGPHKGILSGEARQCTPAGTKAVISAFAPTAPPPIKAAQNATIVGTRSKTVALSTFTHPYYYCQFIIKGITLRTAYLKARQTKHKGCSTGAASNSIPPGMAKEAYPTFTGSGGAPPLPTHLGLVCLCHLLQVSCDVCGGHVQHTLLNRGDADGGRTCMYARGQAGVLGLGGFIPEHLHDWGRDKP